MRLEELGWTDALASAWDELARSGRADEGLSPARVSCAQRDRYALLGSEGSCSAVLTGRLRHRCAPPQRPVVGDWVAVRRGAGHGVAQITECLPRRGALVRKVPEREVRAQVLAANLDVVFLVTSLNMDFSARRIERSLAMIWESGAQPVLLLNKADLCADVASLRQRAELAAAGAPVHALSLHTGAGTEALGAYLAPARTAALIGSSGVGKSTLVNRLLGEERALTGEVRERDDKGRHTTTQRELFVLPGGALLIDTPGMRELVLWDAEQGVDAVFDDIAQLGASCRFADCAHEGEPGCAVQRALDDGSLDAERWHSYAKLGRELAHQERRQDERGEPERRREERQQHRQIARSLRRHPKRERWGS